MEEGPLANGTLPDELVLYITEHLPFTAQFKLGRTNRWFHEFIKDKFLWKKRIASLLTFLGYPFQCLPTQTNFIHLLNDIRLRFSQEANFLEEAFPQLARLTPNEDQWLALGKDIKKLKKLLPEINDKNYLEILTQTNDLLNKINLIIIQWQLPVVAGNSSYLKLEHITRFPTEVLDRFGAYFTSLKSLEVKNNLLRTLPDNIQLCQALESLNVYDNPICYIPETLCQLTELKYLYFSGGCIGKMPEVIYKLRNLQWFSFDNMQLRYISDNINQLVNLTWLYLRHNHIAFLPLGLCCLTKLKTFMCDDNDIYPLQHVNILAFLSKHNVDIGAKKKKRTLTQSGSIDLLAEQMQFLNLSGQHTVRRYLRYNGRIHTEDQKGTIRRNFSFF